MGVLAIVDNGDNVNVDGSQGFASAGALRIGSTFGAAGGTVSVVNGGFLTFTLGTSSYVGFESGTVGNVVVDGLNSRWDDPVGVLQVGYQGQGNVSVTNLGTMNLSHLSIGDLSGNGTVTVSSGGTLNVSHDTYLGRGGGMSEATLNVTGGGRAFLDSLSIGLFAPSTVNVSGAGSGLAVTSDFAVGEGLAGSTLNLSDGGLITVGNGWGTINIGGSGTGKGTFNIGAPAGSLAAAPGTVQAASVNLSATSLLNFNHNAPSYVFSPLITGPGAVRINGGTTRFESANAYTGGTVVNSGALVAAASGALGTGAVVVNGNTASLTYDGAGVTAASAPITLNDSSKLTFSNGASAGSAGITIAADATPSLGAGLVFTQTATAGGAHISNALAPAYNGVTFRGSSSAGAATIQNSNGSITSFQNASTAASANITNLGNGATSFEGSSSAGSSVITNQATGRTYFSFNASGGNAQVVNNAGGILDISGLTGAGTTFGSIEGAGTFSLGTKSLTVGSNGLNTSVSGTITGAGGSLTKVGTGTLTLSGANTYSGGTRVLTGTLEIQNAAAFGSGGVTLSGGNLRSNIAGTATLLNPLSLAHGSLLSAAPGQTLNIDLASVADGAIVLLGSASDTGTLVATGASIATAGSSTVEINGGTVRAGSAQLSGLIGSASKLTLADNATLDLAGFGGSIRDLRGAGTLTGSGGTLQIAGGDFDGSVSGAVAVEKVSGDPLKLDGVSTYTGPTTVRAGYLGVNGSLASAINVRNDGAVGGNGTIGGLSVQSGGFVLPGNSIGTLSVNGNVSFAPGSVYAVEINGAGQSDRIAASGTATLNGGTVMILPDQGVNFLENTPYTIVTAQGGVTGQFAGTRSTDFAFVSPVLGYATNAVTLTMVRKTDPTPPSPPAPLAFHTVAVTENQYRTADAVEALRPGNRLYNTVLGASVSGARQAFDALSGEAHASAVITGYEQAQLIQTTLLDRLRQPFLGSSLLAQSSYATAFAADIPGKAVPAVAVVPKPLPPHYALWGEGFGSWGKTRSNGNAASLDTSTGGFILGTDALIGNAFRVGLAGGFTRTSSDIDGRLSSGSDESVFGALYGSGSWGALTLRLGAAYAAHDFDVSRTVTPPGFVDAVNASYDGWTAQAFGELGYRLDQGQVTLEPFVGASVLRLHTDAFRENGGAAALTGFGQEQNLATTTLGVRAEARLSSDVPLVARGLVGWRHAYGDVEPESLLAFAGGASAFVVSGVPVDRNALAVEAGLDWPSSDAISLGVSYSGQIGERAQDHALKGNFVWRFDTY